MELIVGGQYASIEDRKGRFEKGRVDALDDQLALAGKARLERTETGASGQTQIDHVLREDRQGDSGARAACEQSAPRDHGRLVVTRASSVNRSAALLKS